MCKEQILQSKMLNNMLVVVVFVSLTILLPQVVGWPSFRNKIPNGLRVTHPCKTNSVWDGVGHLNRNGGGKRNQFGQDFRASGFKWTSELCKKDSDKDGKTNGEELGDPNCLWKENMPDPSNNGITHPGVCEPVDSEKCKYQTWVSCDGMKVKCPAMNETGVLTKVIRFPRTRVPPRETTYLCHIFPLPSEEDYHIVGSEPIIDNPMVIHHMILSGCKEDMSNVKGSFDCLMGNAKCTESIGGWTVGSEGECFPKEAGLPFGKHSSRYVQLQVHWTNQQKHTDLFDGSGLRIYYTKKLRPNDLGVLSTGQMHLEIPPNKTRVVQKGICPSDCMRQMLDRAVNITATLVHAHFLGKNLSLAQYRNGQFIRWLAKDDIYSYNNPITNTYNPPILLKPGDELRTNCVYDSTGKRQWTYYGDGTFEEMCFAFLYYYPKLKDSRKESRCTSFERYTMCDLMSGNISLYKHNFGSCNMTEFDSHSYIENVLRACPSHEKTCSQGCKFYVNQMDSHRCMKGFMRKMHYYDLYMKSNITAITLEKARSRCEFVKQQPSATCKKEETVWMIYGASFVGLILLSFTKY